MLVPSSNRPLVESILLDEPGNPAWDVLDRGAVERLLAGPLGTRNPEVHALFGALTAVLWLGGHEERRRIGMARTDVLPSRPPARVAVRVGPAPDGNDKMGPDSEPASQFEPGSNPDPQPAGASRLDDLAIRAATRQFLRDGAVLARRVGGRVVQRAVGSRGAASTTQG